MPEHHTRGADPFSNETELLKQIALFERKAHKLDHANSQHQRDMRSLYLRIAAECRHELEAITSAQAAQLDQVSMEAIRLKLSFRTVPGGWTDDLDC